MVKAVRLAVPAVYILMSLILSYKLPFSALFKKVHTYEELYRTVEHSNRLRTRKGKEYFDNLNVTLSTKFYEEHRKNNDLLIAIGIISVQRTSESNSQNTLGYLYQSASSVDNLLKNSDTLNNSYAFICNVDLYPKRHGDAQHLSHYMPFIERYGNNSIGLNYDLKLPNSNVSFKSIHNHEDIYEKETYDYVFCMNVAASFKPKYILLVEEDAIPHEDFARVLKYLLHFHFKEFSNHHSMSFIKLYFPSKWQGFSFRLSDILDLISFTILGTMIYYFISYFLYLKSHRREDFYKTIIPGSLVSLISCFILGRQNLNELRRILPQFYRIQPSEICCTQAMLYPLQVVEGLSNYMIKQARTDHTDLLIWEYVELKNLVAYQIEPNVFHHIGFHSTLPLSQKIPEEFIFSH